MPGSTHPSVRECIRVMSIRFEGALSERVADWGSNNVCKQLVLRVLEILSKGFNVFTVYLPWICKLVCLLKDNAIRVGSINIRGL